VNDQPLTPQSRTHAFSRLAELAALFLKLGTIGFGGPAAHIALMESEVVQKRNWVTKQQFLDMLGAANLIPGPTSTEMAINVGFARAGWSGLCVAGVSFIVPAALITGAFAWAYVRFGALPRAVSVLTAIQAAIIAIIALAIWRLGKSAVKDARLAALGGLALAAFLSGLNPLIILFGGGVVGMIINVRLSPPRSSVLFSLPPPLWRITRMDWLGLLAIPIPSARPSLLRIGLFFLKIGAVLYGGGYVLLAFLEQGLVHQQAWLTRQQLVDAIAIGQFTPGPVFSTATFIGYLLGGYPGAVVATIAIFLPSFLYVGLLAPLLFRLRKSPWMSGFMDSVNVCAVALMAGVTLKLAAAILHGWQTVLIAAIALAVLLRWKISPVWVVLGAGCTGLGLIR